MTIDVKATVLSALIGGPSVFAAVDSRRTGDGRPSDGRSRDPRPGDSRRSTCGAGPVAVEAPAPARLPLQHRPAVAAPAAAAPRPSTGQAPDGTVQPAAVDLATPPDGMPHLSSRENLPPGTTDTPLDNQGHGVSYLRDIWHAYQTQEVDGKGALLLLTQRPMNADAVPPPGMSANPTPPTAPLPPTRPPPAGAPRRSLGSEPQARLSQDVAHDPHVHRLGDGPHRPRDQVPLRNECREKQCVVLLS